MCLRALVLSLVLTLLAWPACGQDRMEALEVSGVTYSNVFVLSKTPVDLWFTHSMGLSNIKIKDLDPEILSSLGYAVDGVVRPRKAAKMPEMKVDPRVKEIGSQVSDDLEGRLNLLPRNILIGIIAAVVIGYLFFCYCCLLICQKAGSPAPFQVWVPGLVLVALFRAAGLPKWAISLLGAPGFFCGMIPYLLPADLTPTSTGMLTFIGLGALSVLISVATAIVFCVKLSKARNKSPWFALLLLFPGMNIFAFIYLAFSNGETESAMVPSNTRFVTIH